MSVSLKDKNLLFYSIHQNDKHSHDFITELEKNQPLKRQFILVCVSDPNIRIPDKIRQLNTVPVLIVSGFNKPIFGADAVSWLKNNNFQEKGNGFDYGSLDEKNGSFAYLGEEFKPNEYNQFFNSEYNHGFIEKENPLNKQFTNLKTDAHITTFDDSNEMKKDIQGQLEQRLSQLRQQRDADVPKPIKRIGGIDGMNSNGVGGGGVGGGGQGQQSFFNSQNGNSNAPVYNSNPFGNHNIPQTNHNQRAPPQLPFQMSMTHPQSAGGWHPPQPGGMPNVIGGMPNMMGGFQPKLPFQMNTRNPNL